MSLEKKLSLGGLGSLVSGVLLFGAINCGGEGSSAGGCKDDNDCKGDRYCDEETKQCVSEEDNNPQPVSPAQLKEVLSEEFNGSSLDTSQWKNYCFTWTDSPCAEVSAGEDYSMDGEVLKVNYGGIVFAVPFRLGEGKFAVEYKRRNEEADYAIHGVRDIAGQTRLLFWNGYNDDVGFTAGAGVSQGRNEYDVDQELYINEDPHVWHVFRIEVDTNKAVFIADSEKAEFSAKELDAQADLYIWLDAGEYEYVKVWKE